MAAQPSVADRSPLSAQLVGNAFVQQYYHILQQSPELVHRFYQENSKLGWPDAHGEMSLVTTTQAINEKILSMGLVRAETKTVDAQESLGGGFTVLVTGYVTGDDNVKKDFTQSFFLAPQDKGFYVLNDIFRFFEEADNQTENQGFVNGTGAPHAPDHDVIPQWEQQVPDQMIAVEDDEENKEEVYNPSENGVVVEDEEPTEQEIGEVPNSFQAEVVEVHVVTAQEEMPKKSYASIVKVIKENVVVSAPARPPQSSRPTPIRPEPHIATAYSEVPATDTPVNTVAAESSDPQEVEADGCSIFVKSLPLDATPDQLEQEFKRFGPIKPDGIQVRSHKLQGFCYGFVEFEVASAVQLAIEASPVMIGGRPAYVEEKRATGSRVGTRGRFPPGRGGVFRNDARGRGNYGGGRGYGRGDFNTRPDFGGRGGGWGRYSNRASDVGYQRVDHLDSVGGRGRTAASSGRATTVKIEQGWQ